MNGSLGRGTGRLTFLEDTVVKTVSSSWEPMYMNANPLVFVPVLRIERGQFTMPRLLEPVVPDEIEQALLSGTMRLASYLWPKLDLFPQPEWRDKLLRHLGERYTKLVRSLPEPKRTGAIHGDPTFANILFNEATDQWLWCDPLDRAFIPRDPRVDVGKMFQSCWGYEQVILGMTDHLELNEPLARDISRLARIDYDSAMLWCYVHFVRLIPYQSEPHRVIFEEFVNDLRV